MSDQDFPLPHPSALEALNLVLAEREHQRSLGFTADHDDLHDDQELVEAAVAYAVISIDYTDEERALDDPIEVVTEIWPFEDDGCPNFNPGDQDRNLVKAIAVLLAELERRLRRE